MRRWGLGLIGLILLSCYIFSYHTLQKIQRTLKLNTSYHSTVHIPPIFLKFIAGEFRGLVADYSLIEAASIFGKSEKITEAEWDTIGTLFRHTMALDPYFEQSCHLIQGALVWHAKRYDLALSLLDKSKNHRYWDWIPGYFIGFDYFFFLKDNDTASKYLMDASTVRDSPPALATFAARLSQEAGNNQAAMAFLQLVLMKEIDPEKKKVIKTRLETHMIIDVLEKGIRAYHHIYGFFPYNLQVLINEGYISSIPPNPSGDGFIYNSEDGSIKF